MASSLGAFADALAPRARERVRETLAWVAPHCDLEERLALIPPSARVRGIWSRILDRQLQDRGLYATYRERLPLTALRTLGFHPAGDLCVRAAVAGAIVAGPEELHRGMFELSRDNAARFASSLLGRTLVRVLAKDPSRLAQQAFASRRQTCNYGSWELVSSADREVRIKFRREYLWGESYLLGAATGTFAVFGDTVEVIAEMADRFNGMHIIRW